jgi:hypothetical protein
LLVAKMDDKGAVPNVFLGCLRIRRFGPLQLSDCAAMNQRTNALFQELKVEPCPTDLVRSMSGGQRQALAADIGRLTNTRRSELFSEQATWLYPAAVIVLGFVTHNFAFIVRAVAIDRLRALRETNLQAPDPSVPGVIFGGPRRTRTPNLGLRRSLLYPVEL